MIPPTFPFKTIMSCFCCSDWIIAKTWTNQETPFIVYSRLTSPCIEINCGIISSLMTFCLLWRHSDDLTDLTKKVILAQYWPLKENARTFDLVSMNKHRPYEQRRFWRFYWGLQTIEYLPGKVFLYIFAVMEVCKMDCLSCFGQRSMIDHVIVCFLLHQIEICKACWNNAQ